VVVEAMSRGEEELAPRHRVLVPHLPGYGKTPRDAAHGSLDRTTARV
jgi:hypothetical protein